MLQALAQSKLLTSHGLARAAGQASRIALKLLLLPLLLAGCGTVNGNRVATAGQPLRDIAPVKDMNPDPRVIEFQLTAAETKYEFLSGRPTTVWTYNGQLPGPLIEATVGDEIIVHFRNELPEETTVHWHGIRLPANMDGSHTAQAPVATGDSFTYRFTVPDAGLFWYHPHHNGAKQLALGLYGPLLVRGPQEPRFGRERVLVLSDALLNDRHEMVPPRSAELTPLEHAFGVQGNTLLVNGQIRPVVEMQPGTRERWRIVNAAPARYFRVGFPDRSFHLLGADSGLCDRPYELNEILLSNGERADMAVTASATTGSTVLEDLPYSRVAPGLIFAAPASQRLLDVRFSGEAVATPALPATLAPLPELSEPVRSRLLQFTARLDPDLDEFLPRATSMEHEQSDALPQFLINGRAFPDVRLIEAQLGTTEAWVLNNHTLMDHPFHLHGFRFMVLDVDGVPPPYRVWKDTINLPATELGDQNIRVLVDFTGHPGRWVYHCHILHHQERGMMAEVNVE